MGLLRKALDLALGDQEGALVMEAVQALRLRNDRAVIDLQPKAYLKLRADRIRDLLHALRDAVASLGDPAAVHAYVQRLIELDRALPGQGPVSLAAYVGPLFASGRARGGGDPVAEDQAALLALSAFPGHWRIASFVGSPVGEELKRHRRTRRAHLGGEKTCGYTSSYRRA